MLPVPERYLKLSECAAISAISKSSLLRLIRDGQGPPVTRAGSRLVRFPEAAFYQWLKSKTTEAA